MTLQVINSPFTEQQVKLLNEVIPNLTEQQKAWLTGYLSAATTSAAVVVQELEAARVPVQTKDITILFGSQTGNSQQLAKKLAATIASEEHNVTVSSMSDFKVNNLKKLDHLFIIASTHGEGEPPDNAISFYEYLHSKRAPQLPQLKYSVLALGDTSYEFFCKTGIDLDERLKALGAKSIVPRVDCDVDYEEAANKWIEQVNSVLATTGSSATIKPTNQISNVSKEYSRNQPFLAEVLEKINLNGRGSNKETVHLELSLEGSGLLYEPGDVLAIVPENNDQLVALLLTALQFDGSQHVTVEGNEVALQQALKQLDITALSKTLLSKFVPFTANEALAKLLEEREALKAYVYGRDVIDIVQEFGPWTWTPQQFVEQLRKIPAREYSISSSYAAYPEEVHLTIGKVFYETAGRYREGVVSGNIASNVEVGDQLAVYVKQNPNFKLAEPATPIIMIGAGTGIAPFRSFLQEREEQGVVGKSWLFFGDQHFVTDFLYQVEWQRWLQEGVLTNLNIAFSRDQKEKIYVQHRLLEQAEEVYKWIEAGAVIYLCGDEKTLGHSVHEALITVIEQQKQVSHEEATNYVKELQAQKRYQRDVY
ncbi:assimilatory sulfite reductase (NADPH) flavoprotein subunit [Lysinibacillus sp. KU-BSD001]|uniref:assimilatory sulfite reductase (NADPH) flavoprotein subunit n=1 Tax=Lysinibacillus sp. KU-BSD001 TaxID=3141328 RepID=UPI0036EC6764